MPFWLARPDAAALAAPLGIPTRTLPATSWTLTDTPCWGSGRSSSVAGRIVHVWVAGVGSALPLKSVAWTLNVCVPFDRPVYCFGDSHASGVPSSVHRKKAAGSLA